MCVQFEELTNYIKTLEYPFESCVKDLRSQVVRECCITIAYMSQILHHKVRRRSLSSPNRETTLPTNLQPTNY